jgi:2-keto-4-pentenoate hydratase/2-oxohepta-3-ene-1,7-dioic acid hydratase in catechol pathway
VKIICVGRNYAAHIAELQNEKPKEPVLFLKPDTSILQKNQPFFIPHFSSEIHYEVEVLVRIHRIGNTYNLGLLTNTTMKLVWGLTLQHEPFKRN